MQGSTSSLPSRRMLEFVAGPDVEKIGMVCSLPPKALSIRKLTPGGWAETQGVNLGDIMTEVNGMSASKLLAEDLKTAMLQRPLHFRLADQSCNMAALKIQSAERGRVARREVSTIRNAIGDGCAGDDAAASSAMLPASSPSHEHSASSPAFPDMDSQEDMEDEQPSTLTPSPWPAAPAESESAASSMPPSPLAPTSEDLSLEELQAQCRQSGIEPLPAASKSDLLSAIANLQSPAPSSALSRSATGSPLDEHPRKASLQWPATLEEDGDACMQPEQSSGITSAREAMAQGEAGARFDGISKFLDDGGGGSAALAAALSAATKIQSVHRGREARRSLTERREATARRGGHVVSGPESHGLAAALEATSSHIQRKNCGEDTMGSTSSETKADCSTRELAAQKIQRVHRGRQARKRVEVLRVGQSPGNDQVTAAAAAKSLPAAAEAAMEVPSPATLEADLEDAAVTLQRLRRAHVARRNLARIQAASQPQQAAAEAATPATTALGEEVADATDGGDLTRSVLAAVQPEQVDEDQTAGWAGADSADSDYEDDICRADDYNDDVCRVDAADDDYNEDVLDEDIDDAKRDQSDPRSDDDLEGVEGLHGNSDDDEEDDDDNMLAGLEIFCAEKEGYSPYMSPHVRAVPGADPRNFFKPADRGHFTPLEDKMRDLMDHVRMFQEDDLDSPSRRRQAPRDTSPHFDASVREVSAPPLSRSRAQDADREEEQGIILSARGAEHRGARGRACSAEPQETRHWPSRRREISDEEFLRKVDDNDCVQSSEEAGPPRLRAPVPAARRFQLLCPDAPRATRGRSASGATALQEFKTMLLQREHGFVRAWRQILDIGSNGRLTLAELCEGCRRLGFRGNIRELWQQLDADGVGMITLCELDWDSAFALAKFHATLVMRYGKVKSAARQLGLTGMRRFKHDEFCGLLQKHRLAPQHEAASLFKMLCTCPPASALDRDAGVSVRELDWLHMMSKHLPHIGTDRVEPGHFDGASDSQLADISQNGFDDEGIYDEGELDSFDAGVGPQCNIFDKLYQQAMALQERQKDREQSQSTPNQVGTHGPVDPHRFSRLYNDHRVKLEKMERNTEEFYRAQMPHADGPKQISEEVWERLVRPKDKSLEDEPVVVKSDGRTTSLDVLPMAAIRSACEQEGLESRGKTREEMLELLKLAAKEKESRAPPRTQGTQPQMTSRMQALYNDHKQRLQMQKERSRNKWEREEQELQDMQLGGGRRVDPAMYDRLYARAEEKEKRRQQEVEKKEAREIAEFSQPAKGPVKPETFFRLYYDGVDRDVKRNEKKQMKELQEEVRLKEASIHKNKTRDPKCFERLYNNSNNNSKKRAVQRRDLDGDAHDGEVPEQERQHVPEPMAHSRQHFTAGPQGQLPDRHTSEELNRLLRAKEEAAETAQRMAVANMVKSQSESSVAEAVPPGILKGSAGLGARDVTPPRRAHSTKSQASQPARSEDSQRKVTFGSRVSVLEPPCEIELRSAEVGLARDFAEYLFRRFPDSNAAFDAFDIYRTGQVGLTSFISGGKRIQFSGDIKSIFRALDVNHVGQISKSDFRVLMQFHPRVTAQLESSEPLMRSSASAPHFMVRSSAAPASKQQSPQVVHRGKNDRADRAQKTKSEMATSSPQARSNAQGTQRPPCPGESNVCPQDLADQQRILASAYPYKGRSATISGFASKEAPPTKIQQPKARAERGRSNATSGVVDNEELLLASRCAMMAATAMVESSGSQCKGTATDDGGRYPHKGRVEMRPGLGTPTFAGAPSTPDSRPRNAGNSHQLAVLRARSPQESDRAAVRMRCSVEEGQEVPLACDEEFLQIDSAGKRGSGDDYDSDTAVPSASIHSRDCSTPPSPRSSTPPSPRQSVTALPQSTASSAVNASSVTSKLGQAAPRSALAAQRMQRNRNAVVCKDGAAAGQQPEATASQLSRKAAGAHRAAAFGHGDSAPADANSTSHLNRKHHDEKLFAEDDETGKLQEEVMRLLIEYQQDGADLTTVSQERPSQEGAELSSESAWIHHRDSTVA